MFVNINGILLLFLLTEKVDQTFKVGIEFTRKFEPVYEDLNNKETMDFVKEIVDAVSTKFSAKRNDGRKLPVCKRHKLLEIINCQSSSDRSWLKG